MAETAAVRKMESPAQEAPTETWAHVLSLNCDLTVDLPLPGFKLADLLQLEKRTVIDSHWRAGEDVPLRVNGELIAWGEFEVASNQLAVRITELA